MVGLKSFKMEVQNEMAQMVFDQMRCDLVAGPMAVDAREK